MTFYEWTYSLDPSIKLDHYDSIEELEKEIVEIVRQTGKLNLKQIYLAFDCNSDGGLTLSGEL